MKRVFADAFFYIALLNRNDAAHVCALEIMGQGELEVVTTIAVLMEVADAMSAPARLGICAAFLEDLATQPQTTIGQLDEALYQRGLQLYRQRADKDWSLTDCVSFVTMADEGLTDALTGDHHFEQAGFTVLLASP